MPKREGAGRPKTQNPKSNKVSMRLTDEELTRFETYAEEHNIAKADVLRKAVDMLFAAEHEIEILKKQNGKKISLEK